MKLSARNVIKGKVTEVKEGMIMAKVKVDIGGGNVLAFNRKTRNNRFVGRST